MQINIVLTGGPGGGKSMAIDILKDKFRVSGREYRYKNFRCLFMGETASELINGGVAPDTCSKVRDFQSILFDIQLQKESGFAKATQSIPDDDFIVFLDRGVIDGGAYITDEEFDGIYQSRGMSYDDMLSRYDAVFHFETPSGFYTTETNTARSEDLQTAMNVDKRTLKLWSGHKNLHVIKSCESYEDKFNNFFAEFEEFVKNHRAGEKHAE